MTPPRIEDDDPMGITAPTSPDKRAGRPSAQQSAQRKSDPVVPAQRGSAPVAIQNPSANRAKRPSEIRAAQQPPGVEAMRAKPSAPADLALSGARTKPRMAPAADVRASAAMAASAVDGLLDEMDQAATPTTRPKGLRKQPRLDSAQSAAMTRVGPGAPPRGGGLLLAVLVLLAAAGTAAVVYFALPYFT
jgi:hypothetical protein